MEPYLPVAAASAVSVGVGVLLLVSCCRGSSAATSAEPKSKKAKATKQADTKQAKEVKDTKDSNSKEKAKESAKSKDAKDSNKNKEKKKKKAEKPVVTGGRWSALEIEDDVSDDDAPATKKSAQKQQKGKGQGANQNQQQKQKIAQPPKKQQVDSEDDDSPMSKSQRRRQNKKKANQEVSLKSGQTVDADGFVSVVDPKKVRKAQKEKEAKQGGNSSGSNYVPGANYGSAPPSNNAPVAVDDGETAELVVDPKQYGIIIGPEGSTLKKLQEGTLTNIEVPKKDSGSNKIIIRGPRENIQKAKSAISSLLTRGFSSATHPGFTCSEITAVGPAVGVIIGPNGSNIKALQEAFGVRVITPDRKTGSTKVIVAGPKDAVKKAKEAVKSLIQYGFSSATHPGHVMEELTFPRESFNILIGPGGQTIKSIQGDTRTKIHIPDPLNANQNLIIVGPADGVKRAITQINRLLTKEQQNIKQVKYARAKEEEEEEEIDEEARQYFWDGSNDNNNQEDEGIWS